MESLDRRNIPVNQLRNFCGLVLCYTQNSNNAKKDGKLRQRILDLVEIFLLAERYRFFVDSIGEEHDFTLCDLATVYLGWKLNIISMFNILKPQV